MRLCGTCLEMNGHFSWSSEEASFCLQAPTLGYQLTRLWEWSNVGTFNADTVVFGSSNHITIRAPCFFAG